jgi:hypothetical protein
MGAVPLGCVVISHAHAGAMVDYVYQIYTRVLRADHFYCHERHRQTDGCFRSGREEQYSRALFGFRANALSWPRRGSG